VKSFVIDNIAVMETAVITTISFTGNRNVRQDAREKLEKAFEPLGFGLLSYTDIDAADKQMGTLRLWKGRKNTSKTGALCS